MEWTPFRIVALSQVAVTVIVYRGWFYLRTVAYLKILAARQSALRAWDSASGRVVNRSASHWTPLTGEPKGA
jgi:hypothetical protein